MGINKVNYGTTTLIDISNDTVTADKLMQGYTAHDNTGALIIGTATGGSGSGAVWQDAQGYVHLSDEGDIELQTKTVTPTESAQTVTADAGYYALDKVNVGAISSSYVGSSITRRSSSDLTASGATVTVPSGYYSAQTSKAVSSGSAGTPTASKGTVSNHAISVTPSVTNTTGYITGGTKTGSAVSVSASELVSGTYSVTSSGTKDVTNYASVSVPSGTEGTPTASKGTVSNHSVSVTPSVTNSGGYITGSTKTGTAVTVSASELVSGSQTITDNDTYDVTNLASVVVNVSGGGGAIEIATGTFTGTTTGEAKSINLQYDGEGQPVAFMIYPSEGTKNPNGTFNTTIQRYATRSFFAARDTLPVAATYGSVLTSYKSSADTAGSYTQTGTTTQADNPFSVGASASNARTVAKVVKGSSGTFLYAYIASTSYGFMANIEYTYVVFFA